MDHKEVFAVIIAAFGVIILIAVLNMARSATKKPEDSETVPAQTTPIVLTTAKTDIWDVLHNQNTTTTEAAETDENGSAVTTVEGTAPADGSELPAETQPGETLPADGGTQPADTQATELTLSAITAAPETAPAVTEATQPGYTIIVAPH